MNVVDWVPAFAGMTKGQQDENGPRRARNDGIEGDLAQLAQVEVKLVSQFVALAVMDQGVDQPERADFGV